MEPPGPLRPLARAVHRIRRQLAAPSAAERRAHAVAAVYRYLSWCDGYAAALTRKSEDEAARYAVTGEPVAPLRAPVAHVKGDGTHLVLRHYRAWLDDLRAQGVYEGSTALKRLRPDGSWELLDLSRDEP